MTPVFQQRHYNAIAKEIRELFPGQDPDMVKPNHVITRERELDMVRRGVLAALALNLAKRFQKDNPKFLPLKFLEACSPDNNLFPITELWEDE